MTTRLTVLVLCGMLANCRSITTTQTGSGYPPRPPDCTFAMLAKSPETGFAEIGAVKMEHGATGGGSLADLMRFKKEIRSHVCKVGGDAVVPHMSDSGVFVAATIWKENEAATSKEVAKRARTAKKIGTASPGATSASAKAADGCHEDEQCEGDQLCIDGKCALPPAAPLVATPPSEDELSSGAAQEEGE